MDAGVLSLLPVEMLITLPQLRPLDDESCPTVLLKTDFNPFVEGGDCSFGGYKTLTAENEPGLLDSL